MKMWKVRNYCNPTILDKNTIMTDDWCYMNKELIQEQCQCQSKATCCILVDVLSNAKQYNQNLIDSLFDTIKQNGDIHKEEGR